jgi:hypothetical protein
MMEAQRQGYGIKVIVYLRRQDEFLLSRWSQSVKHAIAISQPWEAYKKRILKKEPFLFDYAGTLDKLAGYVGKENIIVRRFDRKAWTNGSILEDFMKCVGLEFTGDFKVLEQDENLSLKGNATEIKRIINGESLFTKEDCLYLGNFLRELSPESGKRYPSCMMSQEEIKAFMKKYEAGNARVAEEYIGDEKPLFRDKIKDLPKWQADNPYMIEDVICFFSAVALDLHRENDQLRGEIKELRIQVNNLRSFREKVKHPVRTLLKRTKV